MLRHWTRPTALAAALCSAAIGLSVAPVFAAPAATALTPEQVVELYIRVALNQDVAATKTLNEYLKPAYNGEDALDVQAVTDAPANLDKQLEEIATGLMQALPKVDPKQAKAGLIAAMKRQNQATGSAKCRSLSSSERANDVAEGQRIAEVRYECVVPAPGAGLQELLADQGPPASLTTEVFLAQLDKFQHSFDTAGTRTVQGTMDLYGEGKDKPWFTGNFSSVIDVVNNGMLTQKSGE